MKSKEKIHGAVVSELQFHTLVPLLCEKSGAVLLHGTSESYARQASSQTNTGRFKFSSNLALRIFTKEGILKTYEIQLYYSLVSYTDSKIIIYTFTVYILVVENCDK